MTPTLDDGLLITLVEQTDNRRSCGANGFGVLHLVWCIASGWRPRPVRIGPNLRRDRCACAPSGSVEFSIRMVANTYSRPSVFACGLCVVLGDSARQADEGMRLLVPRVGARTSWKSTSRVTKAEPPESSDRGFV